jgi:predicted Fe-Mo cluster-binding NifX family protein
MGENVAPCFGYCAMMSLFTVQDDRVVEQVDLPLTSHEPLDRVRLLRDQHVAAIICGGVQDIYEKILRANGIEVISWVSGNVNDLLALYLRGQLVAGASRRDRPQTGRRQVRQAGRGRGNEA